MSQKLKKQLFIILAALALFLVILILEKSGALPAVFENRWAKLLLYLVPYLLSGWTVVRKAVLGVIHGQMLDESFLMTLASIGAFVTGETEEAVAVMLFYQVGEYFQSYAVGKSRASISELMDIAPSYANILREDGSVETADPDDVEIGDTLVVRPGEKIPVDSVVLKGESMLNTAALTGESVPRNVKAGDPVISGCINGEGLLEVRAEKIYDDSTVARILEMVENASEKKSRTENFITRFAKYYTPIVVISALILAIVPPLFTGNWMEWIYRACTFLVISCPCALVISVPLSFFGGIGAASKSGVLVKGSNYLELLSRLKIVVTDKTGTLTEGNFKVSSLKPAEGVAESELLLAADLAESMSTHPIALSIREALRMREDGPKAEGSGGASPLVQVENISGQGLAARYEGSEILVGNARLMEERGILYEAVDDEAATVCFVARDGRYLGSIAIRDLVKEDAKRAVAAMKECGVERVVMLTGDRKGVADSVGRELGITECFSELLPKDKVLKVEELLTQRRQKDALAFLGDGINDAPVLMRADVGIAMGSLGSDAAIEAADAVIMDDNLMRIPMVIRIARKTVGISKQNIVFALGVKVLILVLGALGIAGMWAAVFADVGVAVLCILNSMRLLMGKKTI